MNKKRNYVAMLTSVEAKNRKLKHITNKTPAELQEDEILIILSAFDHTEDDLLDRYVALSEHLSEEAM